MPRDAAPGLLRRHPWHAAAAATSLGVVALLLPMDERVQLGPVTHVAHVAIFAILVLLWMRALTQAWLSPPRAVLLCVAVGVVLAVGTEWAQYWVPGRWPGMGDIARNLLGLALGLALSTWRRDGSAVSR